MSQLVVYQWYNGETWKDHTAVVSNKIDRAKRNGAETVTVLVGSLLYIVYIDLGLQRVEQRGPCHDIRRVHNGIIEPHFFPSLSDYNPRKFELLLKVVNQQSLCPDSACFCLQPFEAHTDQEAVKLPNCQGHFFHRDCIQTWLQQRPQCPYCKAMYGAIEGNCPSGTMSIRHEYHKLPGHSGPDCTGTWLMEWSIPNGVQNELHVNPGMKYTGFSDRTGFIPDTAPYRTILKMLRIAWKRRLMFTIGTSLTTGRCNVVTWSSIHVRSQWHNKYGFGWPAPNYYESVKEELKNLGVTEDQEA